MISLLLLLTPVVLLVMTDVTFETCRSKCSSRSFIDFSHSCYISYIPPGYSFKEGVECFDKLISYNISLNISFNEPPKLKTYVDGNTGSHIAQLIFPIIENVHYYLFRYDSRILYTNAATTTTIKTRYSLYYSHINDIGYVGSETDSCDELKMTVWPITHLGIGRPESVLHQPNLKSQCIGTSGTQFCKSILLNSLTIETIEGKPTICNSDKLSISTQIKVNVRPPEINSKFRTCSFLETITIHACEINQSIETECSNSATIFCQKVVERDVKCITDYNIYVERNVSFSEAIGKTMDLEMQFERLKYNTSYKVLFVSIYGQRIQYLTMNHSLYALWNFPRPDPKVYNRQLSVGHSIDLSKHLYFINTYKSQYACNSTDTEHTMIISSERIPTSEHTPMDLLLYIVPGSVGLISAIAIVVVIYYRKQKTQVKQKFKESIKLLEHPRYSTMVARSNIDAIFEIECERVVIFKEQVLGQGAFGKVYKGRIKGLAKTSVHAISKLTEQQERAENMIVAVKQCYEFADATVKRQLIQEIEIMKELNHHSLVNILYCITQYSDKPISLIMEHCPHGDLLKFLRDSKNYVEEMQMRGRESDLNPDKVVSFNDVAQIAFEVADGMTYLFQKGYIHRDLAARNIMVLEGKHVKIGDFGLCRSVFSQDDVYITNGGKLPIKWMAIESIANYEFSTQSDVWSYGLLLYEVTTLGAQPYADIVPMDGDFRRAMIDHLRSGNRLEQPPACPDEIYSIMKGTWPAKPVDRFTFPEIREITRRLLESLHDLDDGVYGDRYIGMNEVVEENYQPLITITRRGKEYAVRKWTIETRV